MVGKPNADMLIPEEVRDIEVLTQDFSVEAGGAIVRRYINGRLVAERGPDYSLGSPAITDAEYADYKLEFQWKFLERTGSHG